MIVVRRARSRDPEQVQQEMEAVFRNLIPSRPSLHPKRPPLWRPALEVFETEEALTVCAEIAGMDEGHLSVVIDGSLLTIRGERPDPRPHEKRSYHEAGIPYGAFGADVYIPFPVDADRTEASYRHGFLHVVLPRTAARTIVPRQADEDAGQEASES